MKKLLLANVMLLSAFTANAGEAMLGINPVMGKCHIATADESFMFHGSAETKLTINNNYVMATCKAEYIVDPENSVNTEGREDGIACHVGVPGKAGLEVKGPQYGTGGFTVSAGGVATAFCKAPRL